MGKIPMEHNAPNNVKNVRQLDELSFFWNPHINQHLVMITIHHYQ
jgi:hypothetical protein